MRSPQRQGGFRGWWRGRLARVGTGLLKPGGRAARASMTLWNAFHFCSVGLDPPIRRAIATSRDSSFRWNDSGEGRGPPRPRTRGSASLPIVTPSPQRQGGFRGWWRGRLARVGTGLLKPGGRATRPTMTLWNAFHFCSVGLDPPIRRAIAASRDSRLRGNDTPGVTLSEVEGPLSQERRCWKGPQDDFEWRSATCRAYL